MKRGRFTRLTAAGFLAPLAPAAAAAAPVGAWSSFAPIPDARVGAAVAATDAGIFVLGGFSARGERLNQLYDVEANRWSERAPLPEPFNYGAAAAAGRFIYIAGGFNDVYAPKYRHATAAAYAYDTKLDTWAKIAKLPTARGGLIAVERRGTVHMLGGRGDGDVLTVHEAYDPRSDRWETYAPMLSARGSFAGVYLGGYIYVLGGIVAGSNAFTGSLDAYDPIDDRWRPLMPMPAARSNFGAGVLMNSMLAFGGQNAEGTLRSAVSYEPERDRWTDVAEMPARRHSFVTARAGLALYAIGGSLGLGLSAPTPANDAFAFS